MRLPSPGYSSPFEADKNGTLRSPGPFLRWPTYPAKHLLAGGLICVRQFVHTSIMLVAVPVHNMHFDWKRVSFFFRFQRTASRLRLSATWGSTSLTESPERPSRHSSYWPSRRSSERGSTWVSLRGQSSRRHCTSRRHR